MRLPAPSTVQATVYPSLPHGRCILELELIRGFFDEFVFCSEVMLCSAYQQREPIRFASRTLLPPERGYGTSAAVTVVFIFCLLTQAPLDVLDMVARHHDEHLNAFQQPPPLDESHWSQTSEEGSDLHSPVIYEQTFVHEPGACAFPFPAPFNHLPLKSPVS